MLLYTCAQSRGLRVSWTAAELGIDLEYRMMPFPPRMFSPEYLAENPLGTVPMLVDGDARMTESTAICHYLAVRAEDRSLIVTSDEADFGWFLDLLHYADATLTFPQTVFLRFARLDRERGLAEAGEAYSRWFGARLVKLEARIAGRDFLCADRFTIADIAVCYALYLAQMTGLDEYFGPNVAFYIERQMQRPAFSMALDRERAASTGISPCVADAIAPPAPVTRGDG